MTRPRFIIGAFAACALVACASEPRPGAVMASSSSQGAIRGAQEVGAANVPAAAQYLNLATEQHQHGVALSHDGKTRRAEYMFSRSEADAELAIAIARAETANAAAQATNQEVQELKQKATPTQNEPNDEPGTDDEKEEQVQP